jgi:hypothetical protein
MLEDRVELLVASIIDGENCTADQIVGLTEDEIRAVELSQPSRLAPTYRRFLELAGAGAGDLLLGSDLFYPVVLELGPWAHGRLQENGVQFTLSNADRVFYMHQGYQFDFLRGDGDDAEVWSYHESRMPEPTLSFRSFTDWLDAQIRNQMTWRRLRSERSKSWQCARSAAIFLMRMVFQQENGREAHEPSSQPYTTHRLPPLPYLDLPRFQANAPSLPSSAMRSFFVKPRSRRRSNRYQSSHRTASPRRWVRCWNDLATRQRSREGSRCPASRSASTPQGPCLGSLSWPATSQKISGT